MVGQTIGRLLCTIVTAVWAWPALILCGCCTIGMLIGHIICTITIDLTAVTVVFVLIAATYGALYVVVAPSIAELFGLAGMVALYGVFALAPAFAPLVFGQITGALYDARADAQHTCYGRECFRASFVVASVALGLAVVCWAALLLRKRARDVAVEAQVALSRPAA
jgi:MFS family permease